MSAFVPVMHQERFCELTSISFGVLESWVNPGLYTGVVIGKHKPTNISELTEIRSHAKHYFDIA